MHVYFYDADADEEHNRDVYRVVYIECHQVIVQLREDRE